MKYIQQWLRRLIDTLYKASLEGKETFYHPITGYKGNWSDMETYIKNRERKI